MGTPAIRDRVRESSTTTGTGTFDLDGATTTQFQTFVTAGYDAKLVPYVINNPGTGEWEVGLGTITDAAPDTLARVANFVQDGSSGPASLVNFAAGTKAVYLTDTSIIHSSLMILGNTAGLPIGLLRFDAFIGFNATAASRSQTLPSVVSVQGTEITFLLESTSGGNTLTLTPDGAETIAGAATLVLYVADDTVTLVADGSSQWRIKGDGRQAHAGTLRRNALQLVSTGAAGERVEYDVADVDNATLATNLNGATAGFTIKRAGNYMISCQGGMANIIDDNQFVEQRLLVNGTSVASFQVFSSLLNEEPRGSAIKVVTLAVSDVVAAIIEHNEGSSRNTSTVAGAEPSLSIMEIRT